MINVAARCGALLALVVLSTTCSGGPTAPTPAPPTTTVKLLPVFPTITRPARVYVNSELYAYLSGSSRFVLYADGTFTLQFSTRSRDPFEYRGKYSEVDAQIRFDWEDWGLSQATGLLSDDFLTVRYSSSMMLSDFEDGVYVLTRDP